MATDQLSLLYLFSYVHRHRIGHNQEENKIEEEEEGNKLGFI